MAITRAKVARQKAMRIISQSPSHRCVIVQTGHLSQEAAGESIPRAGSRRSTMKTLTNKIMRKAHVVLFAVIVLATLIQEIVKP